MKGAQKGCGVEICPAWSRELSETDVSLIRDAMRFPEAAQYLGVPEYKVALAVIQDHLRCGVMARGWTGTPLPELPGVGAWRADYMGARITVVGEKIHRWRWARQCDDEAGRTVLEIEERRAGQFWFLAHEDSNPLFEQWIFGDQSEREITWLIPLDGAWLQSNDPDGWPPPPFCFWINDADPARSRKISVNDVLFLRQDLADLRERLQLVPKFVHEPLPEQMFADSVSSANENPNHDADGADSAEFSGKPGCVIAVLAAVRVLCRKLGRRPSLEDVLTYWRDGGDSGMGGTGYIVEVRADDVMWITKKGLKKPVSFKRITEIIRAAPAH